MSQVQPNSPPPIPPSRPSTVVPRASGATNIQPRTFFERVSGAGLSGIALVVAVVALLIALFGARNPLGKGMSAYDFSTPSAAVKSMAAAHANNDILTMIQLEQMQSGRYAAEKLKSLKVDDEVSSGGRKVVHYSYTEDGVDRHGTETVEKDADTGLWIPVR